MDLSKLTIHTLREKMSNEEITALINSLSEEEAQVLMYNWEFWARWNQLEPDWAWFGWVILSGRGFGKTRTGAEWIRKRAKAGYFPIVLAGETAADVRDVMIEAGESSIMRTSPPDFRPVYEPSKRRLTWPNGAFAIACSGQDPDQFRGLSTATAWFDEPAKWDYAEQCITDALMGLRESDNPRFLATTTPRPIKIIKDWYNESQLMMGKNASIHVTLGSTYDNMDNLAPQFIREMKKRYEGTRLGEQELNGKILWESENALWKQADIDEYRVSEGDTPEFDLTALSVDPTVGDPNIGRVQTKRAIDECGLVLGGRGKDGHGYTLKDFTMRGSPQQWAQKINSILEVYNPDFIVAEKNQGGELVRETLKAYGIPEARIVLVNASRGKLVRAEPISLMAEQGKIHNVGEFPKLEEELVTYEGKGKSPNRLDAYVWLYYFLLMGRRNDTVVTHNLYADHSNRRKR